LLAKNLGAKAIWLNNQSNLGGHEPQNVDGIEGVVALETTNWEQIYEFLKLGERVFESKRTTKETDIHVKINLDGTGEAKISTGLHFFDHMLDQIARHGSIDLEITTKGDLHIDEHHTIEDTGIALGEVFAIALGNKKGIERYGFCLPMDDCLAQAAIDFGGRNWLVWDADFKREKLAICQLRCFITFLNHSAMLQNAT
jgi:imidazoleglycerol-phosphate dehydratase/histidinol-phosphatase